MSFLEKLMFSDLTIMMDKCLTATNATIREKYVKKYFDRVLELQRKYKEEFPRNNASVFPLIRILLATDEHERAYGIQEKTLRKILIKALNIEPSGTDARRIEQCNENEISDTVYDVARSRNSRESKLTIQQVDDILNNLCDNQKQQFQQNQFEYLFLNGSASDLKWIARIVLKNMKLKIKTSSILTSYHSLAPKLYSKFNHLSKVCELIENGNAEEAVKDVAKPFIPIRSMLSQKFSSNMNNIIETSEFYTEIKLDGERFQVHMENGEWKYFSRNAHEFSDNFNILVSPLLKFKVVVHSIILDGEMIMWNKTKKRFVTKGETELDVKKLKDPNHHLRPCYCAFDVLYLNGMSYLDQPFSRRSEILNSLFDDQEGVFIKTKPIKIRDAEHLVTLFNDALQKEEEGIILKKADSIYMPGEREKGGWYKVKADYFDGELVQDFDCVIVGGSFQNSFKKDYLKKFYVGAVEKIDDRNFNVYTIGEVAHGLSIANSKKLNEKLSPFFIDFPRKDQDIEFEMGHVLFGRSKPDVFIPPHKSIVLQIRVSELAPSSEFYEKLSFRFPRISEIRYDKFWDESMTFQEYKELIQGGDKNSRIRKVNKRNVQKDDIVSPTSKKRKIVSSRAAAIAEFCHDSQEDVESIDNVLEGKEFCVKTTSESLPSVHDLKIFLRLHGGSITEFPRRNKTFAIVAGYLHQTIKNYIKEGLYSVIKAECIAEHFSTKQPLEDCPELHPNDFHFINEAMREMFSSKYDEYGDSYTGLIHSYEELEKIVNGMDTKEIPDYTEFENEIYTDDFPNPNIFRGLSASFCDSDMETNYLMKSAKSIFTYRAGQVTLTSNIMFIDKSSDRQRSNENHQKLVDFRFILNSNDAGRKLDIQEYVI